MNNFVALDEMTGVSTRKHFLGRLQEETQRATEFGTDIAVVMLSNDRLEEQVGRHGKDALDIVLQSIGRMIKTSVRPYDVVGRIDVNRFSVVLVHTNANEATLWAEKIRKNVASNIINIDNRSFTVTISVGVAGPSADMTDLGLLEKADRVLKKAIEAGGNLVRVF
jgi:diguanylate cyclase (GGDEF)-like protein